MEEENSNSERNNKIIKGSAIFLAAGALIGIASYFYFMRKKKKELDTNAILLIHEEIIKYTNECNTPKLKSLVLELEKYDWASMDVNKDHKKLFYVITMFIQLYG